MSKKDKKQLDGVDALTAYLYADSLFREDIKLLKKEIKRLTELNKWQPIDTAPKDGTTVIGWIKHWGEPMLIQWVCIQQWNDPNDVFGWAEESDWSTSVTPTHWMPLPPPPTQ